MIIGLTGLFSPSNVESDWSNLFQLAYVFKEGTLQIKQRFHFYGFAVSIKTQKLNLPRMPGINLLKKIEGLKKVVTGYHIFSLVCPGRI